MQRLLRGQFPNSYGCLLHAKARGLNYDDPSHPNGQLAAQTNIPSFVCPSTPVTGRDPNNYGAWDYMFIDLTDIDETVGSPTFGERTLPTGSAAWLASCSCRYAQLRRRWPISRDGRNEQHDPVH